MATFSVRMPDDLKRKAAQVAKSQGVSMNNFVVSAVATAAAQCEAHAFFQERLKGKDRDAVRGGFAEILSKTRPGKGPTFAEIERLRT